MCCSTFQPVHDLAGKHATVLGLGRFGGGAGVTRWLINRGATVILTDLLSESELADSLRELDDLHATGQLTLHLGSHTQSDFESADVVIASPAVPRPWDNPYLQAATAAGVPITTEINLLINQLDRQRVIGVTGSAGKSTTAAMITHIIKRLGGCAHLGGNFGGSLLNNLHDIEPNDWIVLELSSAMLHWLNGWSPATAVITNIAPNHLDWHGSFEHYEQSKLNIQRFKQPGEHFIRGDRLPSDTAPHVNLRIPGKHNLVNAQTAVETVRCALDIDPNAAALALDDFTGLPHRLSLFTESDGLRFYNDSKSTTPDATLRAVESFPDASHIHLIAGGSDKGVDLSAISNLAPQLAGLYTIGTTSTALTRSAPADDCVIACKTLQRAVGCAFARMHQGDILLLSPGCASWDQFDNFEQRGRLFVDLVRELLTQECIVV